MTEDAAGMSVVLEKFHSAVPLTDREAFLVFHYYRELHAAFVKVAYCPPEYKLMRQDIDRRYERVREMMVARELI